MGELEGLDEYRLEARAKEILTGMGFHLSDLDRPLTEFSGGWLMRVASPFSIRERTTTWLFGC